MRTGAHWIAVLGMGALASCTSPSTSTSPFPVKDARSAIAIAKDVCRGKADPSLKWSADLDVTGSSWGASTMGSLKKSGDHLWYVEVPVAGPYPDACYDSGYDLRIPDGPKSH